ncbi:MAG: cyclic nucleotide-binding domain-containing protein, partial [Gammaproteobacteria bacterium]
RVCMSGCGHLSIKDLRQVCSSCSHASLCLPVGLEPADLQLVDNLISQRRVVNKGSYVFKAGNNFECLIAVRSGAFKTTNDNAEGVHSVIGFYLPGELIGFDGITKGIHQISAQAIETSSICEIPFNDLLSFASKMPSLQRQVISIMSQQTIPDMTLRLNHSAEQRVASFLLDLSRRFKNCGYSASEFN